MDYETAFLVGGTNHGRSLSVFRGIPTVLVPPPIEPGGATTPAHRPSKPHLGCERYHRVASIYPNVGLFALEGMSAEEVADAIGGDYRPPSSNVAVSIGFDYRPRSSEEAEATACRS